MKKKFSLCRRHSFFLMILLSVILNGCNQKSDPVVPTLSTVDAGSISSTSATMGGNITDDGGSQITARGVCWNTSSGPTTANNKTSDGTGTGSFSSALSGLNPGVTYYAKAYAVNEAGTGYGNEISFKTNSNLATLTTNAVSALTTSSASTGGNITSDGGGAVTARGVCWSTSQNPTTSNSKTTDGSGTGSFTSSITGLTAATTYYIRAYATNSAGTSYGNQLTFVTTQSLSMAVVTTSVVTNITTTAATLGGNVTSDGNANVTERGTVVSASPNPTTAGNKFPNGTGTGSFSSNITGFTPNTTYYVRAYAINSQGTSYGIELSFKTLGGSSGITFNANLTYGTLTDIEGNVYKTIPIGTQTWMAENLKTTKYKDGTAIPLVTDNDAWCNLSTPAYSWYNNAISNKDTYGALYNWYTINTGKLCPTGYHVPSHTEWSTLTTYLGGEDVSGTKLKEVGTAHWSTSATSATNSTGFTAVGGGSRASYTGTFYGLGMYGKWWSSTAIYSSSAWMRDMGNYSDVLTDNVPVQNGYSVRCIKD